MTDLSILLHAAARGARLQWFDTHTRRWFSATSIPLNTKFVSIGEFYSIHPDDEHLMWGPLSRQYYEAALFGDVSSMFDPDLEVVGVKCGIDGEEWDRHYAEADEPTRRMILLTIAYALRDEGM